MGNRGEIEVDSRNHLEILIPVEIGNFVLAAPDVIRDGVSEERMIEGGHG